jgi:hypothetical protein
VTLQVALAAQEVRLGQIWPKTPPWDPANEDAALAEHGSASTMPTVISIVKSADVPGITYMVGFRSPVMSAVESEPPPSNVAVPAVVVTCRITVGCTPEASVITTLEVPAPEYTGS